MTGNLLYTLTDGNNKAPCEEGAKRAGQANVTRGAGSACCPSCRLVASGGQVFPVRHGNTNDCIGQPVAMFAGWRLQEHLMRSI